MAEYDYDLFVVGGGSGGVRAARIAASHGAKVGIAEEFRYGGTCVIRGCVPKKLLVYASRFPEEFEDADGYGWIIGDRKFSWTTLIENKNREIDRLEDIYRNNLVKAGVETFDSRAILGGPNTIDLTTIKKQVSARIILIATGGKPFVDDKISGNDLVFTSNEAFHLPKLPSKIIVVGGGYIAVEFAGIFNGLGSDTTLLYRGEEILRGFDNDVRRILHREMEAKGITVVTGDVFEKIEKSNDGLTGTTTNGATFKATEIMYATGRHPNTKGIGLETTGVETDTKGAIVVNEHSQTNVENIYAVGDVTNRINLTPVAIREGHAFADSVFGKNPATVDHRNVASAVFSQPEIGTVGLTEEQARESYKSLDIYKSEFNSLKSTLSKRKDGTFIKLIVDADSDKILGSHIVGHDAGEISQFLGITMKMGATKKDFDATIAVHPTVAEEFVTMREPSERIR